MYFIFKPSQRGSASQAQHCYGDKGLAYRTLDSKVFEYFVHQQSLGKGRLSQDEQKHQQIHIEPNVGSHCRMDRRVPAASECNKTYDLPSEWVDNVLLTLRLPSRNLPKGRPQEKHH